MLGDRDELGRPALVDEAVEILAEALGGLGEAHVLLEMCGVLVGDRAELERPGAVLRYCDGLDIETRERRAREHLVLEQIALPDLLDSDYGFRRGVRHDKELSPAADPDIAVPVREGCVEKP